jgi:hypothetical protein
LWGVFFGVICSAFIGCGESRGDREIRLDYWGQEAAEERVVGKMTDEEVEVVRAKLSQTKFPAPARTVAKILGVKFQPFGIVFEDRSSPDPAGRIGGNVMDYWLNAKTVLRVGSVYYSMGDIHSSPEEWFQILTAKQAYSRKLARRPYGPAENPEASSR